MLTSAISLAVVLGQGPNTGAMTAVAKTATLAPAATKVTRLKTFEGTRIVSAAGSPVGAVFAVGLENNTVKVVNAATMTTLFTLTGHPQPCYGLGFTPDGRYLATGDDTARIYLWDLKTGKKVREYPRDKGHKRGIQSISFSKDGKLMATVGKDDVINVWNFSGGNPVKSILGSGANFYGASFSPAGSIVTGTLKEGIRIYGKTFSLAATLSIPGQGGMAANDLVMNKLGTLAVTSGRDSKVTVWNVGTKTRLGVLSGHQDWAMALAMAPNGRFVASSSNDRTIRFWDIKTMTSVSKLDNMSVVGSPVAFTGNGKYFIAANSSDYLEVYEVYPPAV